MRVSAHSLNIETGRYKNILKSERKCTNCSKGDIEDEKMSHTHVFVVYTVYMFISILYLLYVYLCLLCTVVYGL